MASAGAAELRSEECAVTRGCNTTMFATRSAEATYPGRQGSSKAAPRLLVVEDTVPDAQLVELELRRAAPELTCRFVSTVQEARLCAKAERFDAILLDLQLPDSRGLDTLRLIRQEYGNTPVVVLTGQVDMKLALASLRSGASDFLTKQDMGQLEPTLRRVLAEATAEREKREHERELLRRLELESVERLAAGLAHEINSPIQFVGDNLVFLRKAFELMLPAVSSAAGADNRRDGEGSGVRGKNAEHAKLKYALEQVPAAIEQALAGVSRVARLISTMRDHLGPPEGQCTRVDIRGLLESSLWRCRDHWQPVAEVSTDYAPDVPDLLGYPEQLAQAFVNVLINATEAVRRRPQQGRGSISIRTRKVDESVEVSIGDDGPGIPGENISKVFDPYFTTKIVSQGTGQGLTVAHGIVVNKHGGTIRVQSEPGHGATFIVSLPLSVPHAAAE
jgi:signal transduction histidine kinase